MHHLDIHREHMRRYYHEQKEKIEFHRQLYEKYGGEREYYKNLYKSLSRTTDGSNNRVWGDIPTLVKPTEQATNSSPSTCDAKTN